MCDHGACRVVEQLLNPSTPRVELVVESKRRRRRYRMHADILQQGIGSPHQQGMEVGMEGLDRAHHTIHVQPL